MEKINDYQVVAEYGKKAFKPGIWLIGQCDGDTLKREIQAGTLYVEKNDASLLLLRKRDGFYRVTGYLGDSLPELPAANYVTEIACKERDREKALALVRMFENSGFRVLMQRLRRARSGSHVEFAPEVRCAQLEDAEAAAALLAGNFSAVTGCLPTFAELQEAIKADKVLLFAAADGSPCGVLHLERNRAYTEIRHLCVGQKYRQNGVAQALLDACLAQCDNGKCRVWTKAGNLPAENLYEKNGFQTDGFASFVLSRGKE